MREPLQNTEATLAELERLEAAATPGPWKTDVTYVVGQVPEGRPGGEVIAYCRPTVERLRYTVPSMANAAFIAAARAAMPALVAEVRRLQARHQELLAAVAQVSRETPYPDELKDWEAQRGKLLAEIGTLRARAEQAERDSAAYMERPLTCTVQLVQDERDKCRDALRWAANTVHQAHHTDEKSMKVAWTDCEHGFCASIRRELGEGR